MPSGVVSAQVSSPFFPLSYIYKCKSDSLLGTGSYSQEEKEASGNFDHWLEKALQVVTGPQEDEPKIGASPLASRGNANLAGGSAQVPRSSLVCDLIK